MTKCQSEPVSVVIRIPLGRITARICSDGVHQIDFTDILSEKTLREPHDHKCQPSPVIIAQDLTEPVTKLLVEWFTRYFSHQPTENLQVPLCCFSMDFSPTESNFARRCWHTLQKEVGVGRRISYGELADLMGTPKAARAVGTAMRTNPVPFLIPCHRVVKSDGSLGNYSSGNLNHIKKWLLDFEAERSK